MYVHEREEEFSAMLTRMCTPAEKKSSEGVQARSEEVHKVCQFGGIAEPVTESTARSFKGATASGVHLLTSIKSAERAKERTGTKYHTRRDCSGLRNATSVSEGSRAGLEPCQLCAGGTPTPRRSRARPCPRSTLSCLWPPHPHHQLCSGSGADRSRGTPASGRGAGGRGGSRASRGEVP